jgi:D-arabinose 1-dehydrogenase-like Zn-dependent alcohol dehydrogenase
MKSQQIIAWGEPLEERETPTPTPTGTQVLVRVQACGVCHSDVHIHEGFFDLGNGNKARLTDAGVTLPFTLGHEVVGVIEAVGPDAVGVKIGAPVVVYPWTGCETCARCVVGDDNICEVTNRSMGTRRDGGYSDHVMVGHPRYLVDYGSLDPMLAATCACSGLTAYSALKKLPKLTADDTVLVVGAGGVGLSAVGLAAAMTPARIAVADIDPVKLDAARVSGAALTIDTRTEDPRKAIVAAFGAVPRAIIDFVAAPATVESSLATCGRGGTIVLVGLFGGSITLPTPLLTMRSLSLIGSYVGSLSELKELIAIMQQRGGTLPIATRPMREVNDVLSDLRAGKITGRVVATV